MASIISPLSEIFRLYKVPLFKSQTSPRTPPERGCLWNEMTTAQAFKSRGCCSNTTYSCNSSGWFEQYCGVAFAFARLPRRWAFDFKGACWCLSMWKHPITRVSRLTNFMKRLLGNLIAHQRLSRTSPQPVWKWVPHYGDITWASWCLPDLFVQQLIETDNKGNIKAPHSRPMLGESTGYWLIPLTTGPEMRKSLTISWRHHDTADDTIRITRIKTVLIHGNECHVLFLFFSPAAVREQVPIIHPEDPELAHLHGTILTDGNDQYTNEPTANVLIFANQQVSRSTCGTYLTVINDET